MTRPNPDNIRALDEMMAKNDMTYSDVIEALINHPKIQKDILLIRIGKSELSNSYRNLNSIKKVFRNFQL